ncbi:NACHT domain-containing protein [Nonomuraea lactucae]|uniref:NACHT domain-containing protein n=1 Tax=Nonomuraea lactucae TaxID=2249762 RepID=UPI001F06007F|nr:NACHT domain-containing protein [Nonomuraea lactucae]
MRRVVPSGWRYRRSLLSSLRFIDLKGLATIGFHTPRLDDVYVDVSLAYGTPDQISQGVLACPPSGTAERHSIRDLLDRREPAVLAIVGGPGSGKTTLLCHTARRICQARLGRRRRAVPMVLYLRDHVRAIVSRPAAALSGLACEAIGDAEPAGWLEQRLHAGDCVVMLDGLDEVARQEDRERVAAWVECQIARYPRNDYVITSRPHGYLATPIAGAALLQVRGFTREQVARFVRGWYLVVETHSAGGAGAEAGQRAEAAAADLLDRTDRTPALHDLTGNPLLLTMIANAHRYRGALPGSRARLYGEICQVILWRRHEAKKLPLELGGDEKEVLLRRLASVMMARRVRDLSRAEVVAELEPVIRRFSTRMTVPDFLADVGSNGLLMERENGLYSFVHHTFQEYLAAAHIRDKGHPGILADAVDDLWWRETTLLYAARADTDPIVRACLASRSVTALSLAFDCAEQGGQLAPELRERLDELLGSAFARDADPRLRRLLAAVLATRHLRSLIATGGGGRVCASPIPHGIYWLYRQDTGCPPPDGPPSLRSVPDERDRDIPVAGVRGADALGFANWINGVTGTETGYRLPSHEEMEDPAVRRALDVRAPKGTAWSAWLMPENTPRPGPERRRPPHVLWTPAGASHPHRIDPVTLARHVYDDVARSTPTLIRMLLLRAIVTVRALAHGLDLVPVLDIALDQVLDYAFDLGRTVDHVGRLDENFPLGRIRAVISDLNQALNESPDRARDLAAALDHDLNRAVPGPVEPLDLVLGVGFQPVIDDALARNRAFNRALEHVMGSLLSLTLSRVLRHDTPAARWLPEFARELVQQAMISPPAFTPSPDLLPHQARHAGRELLELRAPASPWLAQVAGGLAETAWVFERRCPRRETATAVRLAALCLAAEADAHAGGSLSRTFHEIAAGVTLLERRATGQSPPTETIVLATG